MGVLRRFLLYLFLFHLALPGIISGEEVEYNRLKTQIEGHKEIRLSLLVSSYFYSFFSFPGKLGEVQLSFLYSNQKFLSLELQLPVEILYLEPAGNSSGIILLPGDPSIALGREFPLFSGIFFLEGGCILPGKALLPSQVQVDLYPDGTAVPSLSLVLGFSGIRDPMVTTLSLRLLQDFYLSPERAITREKGSLSIALTVSEALNPRFAYSVTLSDTINYHPPTPKSPLAEIENYAHLSITCHWFLGEHSLFAGREISFSGNGSMISGLGGYSVDLLRGRGGQ